MGRSFRLHDIGQRCQILTSPYHLMSASAITSARMGTMGRWEPDARGRLEQAALELFEERGYARTTVADIAARAGLTERTFFRYFADKREVLFSGSATLQNLLVDKVASAPASMPPIDAVARVLAETAPFFEPRRDFA